MRPNLLFVFADQHRRNDIGCYGNTQVITPNLDKFSQDALVFDNCITNSPVCVPARGSLLTGLFCQKHGAFTNDIAINYDVVSIANVLNDAGYHTGYIGKWHLCGIPRDQFIEKDRRLGFQEWKVANCNHNYLKCYYDDEENKRHFPEGYEPEIFGALSVDFIQRNQNKDKPWALYCSFASPHNPHTIIKEKYWNLYKDTEIELPDNVPEEIMQTKTQFMSKEEQIRQAKGYYGHISAIDEQFGILLQTLKDTDQLDNTIIVYTADHGDMLGSHGTTDKQLPYEEAIGIPLLLSWKGKTVIGRTDEMIGIVDLSVSLAGLMGESFPCKTDGIDLHALFVDEKAKGLENCYAFELYPCHNAYAKGYTEWRAIRNKRYTYAITAEKEWLLFDNQMDPLQKENQIDNPAYAEIKADLAKRLREHIEKNDALVDGDGYIRMSGKWDEFNRSQAYFHMPLLEK